MTLDTNILIAYLNGERRVVEAVDTWKAQGRVLLISVITFSEVLSLPNLTREETAEIKSFLASFLSIPLDNALGETAALLRRIYRLSLPDAAIAATALTHHTPLVTRDRQFRKIKEITVVEI